MNYSVVIYILGWIMKSKQHFWLSLGSCLRSMVRRAALLFCGWHLAVRLQVQQLFAETEEHAVLSAGRFRDGSTFVDSDVCDWMSAVCDQW